MKNIDLGMSLLYNGDEGGDLQLSAPFTNKNGEVVADLALAYGNQVTRNIVYTRIRTQAPNWFLHPTLGGNLEDLVGEPNTKDTAQRGVTFITNALMYDNFLEEDRFTVRAIPVNREEILFVIVINSRPNDIVVPIQFNYNYGMKLVGG